MKKCIRCGKMLEDDIMVCDECSFSFEEHKIVQKKLGLNKKPNVNLDNVSKTDLIDYPILTFVFGILSLCIPIYLFSVLALLCSKKPTKESLEACVNVGKALAYIGFAVSTVALIYLITIIF